MSTAPIAHIKAFGSELLTALDRRYDGTECHVPIETDVNEAEPTQGWWLRAADLGPRRPKLEVWYDRFLPLPKPTLWIGRTSRSWPSLVQHYADRVLHSMKGEADDWRVLADIVAKHAKVLSVRQASHARDDRVGSRLPPLHGNQRDQAVGRVR